MSSFYLPHPFFLWSLRFHSIIFVLLLDLLELLRQHCLHQIPERISNLKRWSSNLTTTIHSLLSQYLMRSHTLLPLIYNIKTNPRNNSLSWSIKKNQLKKFARSKMESKKRNTHIYLYTKNTALQIETKHWRRNRLVSARTAHIKHNCFPVIRLPPRTRSWSKVIISLIFSPIALSARLWLSVACLTPSSSNLNVISWNLWFFEIKTFDLEFVDDEAVDSLPLPCGINFLLLELVSMSELDLIVD